MPVTADQLLIAARSAVRATPPQLLDVLRCRHGFDEDDLVQEGAMAGWKAMSTAYDPAKGQAGTFLTMRARFALRHLARSGGLVKTPRGQPVVPCRQFAEVPAKWRVDTLNQGDLIESRTESDGAAGLWDEARHLRRGWDPLARLWAYLVLVEGMSHEEVAGLWGVNKARISDRLRAVGVMRYKTGLTADAA